MNLRTRYLGLDLRSPLVPGASPLSEDLDNLRQLEDAGAAAIVFHSLFEEQIRHGTHTLYHHTDQTSGSRGGTNSYFPEPSEFSFAPDRYLDNIEKAKRALGIPVIASLNGATFGGWTTFAKAIEGAGADALELNFYSVPSDPEVAAEEIELGYLSILASIKSQVKIPVSVKLSPYFTNLGHFARRLVEQGARGLVLFNRFYQPDIDLNSLTVAPRVHLSTPGDILLPLRWIAMLHGRLACNLAGTTGVFNGADVLKMLMAGADVAMLCSVLLKRGIDHLRTIENEICNWMTERGYESLEQVKGRVSQKNCPDPSAFERAQYMRVIATERSIQQS